MSVTGPTILAGLEVQHFTYKQPALGWSCLLNRTTSQMGRVKQGSRAPCKQFHEGPRWHSRSCAFVACFRRCSFAKSDSACIICLGMQCPWWSLCLIKCLRKAASSHVLFTVPASPLTPTFALRLSKIIRFDALFLSERSAYLVNLATISLVVKVIVLLVCQLTRNQLSLPDCSSLWCGGII